MQLAQHGAIGILPCFICTDQACYGLCYAGISIFERSKQPGPDLEQKLLLFWISLSLFKAFGEIFETRSVLHGLVSRLNGMPIVKLVLF